MRKRNGRARIARVRYTVEADSATGWERSIGDYESGQALVLRSVTTCGCAGRPA